MPSFGQYVSVKLVHSDPDGDHFLARAEKGSPQPLWRVKTCRVSDDIEPGSPEFKGLDAFLDAARIQKSVAADPIDGAYWAPILECDRGERQAFYVTRQYDNSLDQIVDSIESVRHADIHRIVSSILRGLRALKRVAGRTHGNLTPTNVLVSGRGELARCRIVLSDPAPPNLTHTAHELDDLTELGRMLGRLLERPGARARTRRGARTEDSALKQWRSIADWLIGADTSRGDPSIERVLEAIPKPPSAGRRWLRFAAAGLIVGLVVFGGIKLSLWWAGYQRDWDRLCAVYLYLIDPMGTDKIAPEGGRREELPGQVVSLLMKEGASLHEFKKATVDPNETGLYRRELGGSHPPIDLNMFKRREQMRKAVQALENSRIEGKTFPRDALDKLVSQMLSAVPDGGWQDTQQLKYDQHRYACLLDFAKQIRDLGAFAGILIDERKHREEGAALATQFGQRGWGNVSDYVTSLISKIENATDQKEKESDVRSLKDVVDGLKAIAAVRSAAELHARDASGQPDGVLCARMPGDTDIDRWVIGFDRKHRIGVLADLTIVDAPDAVREFAQRAAIANAIEKLLQSPAWQQVDRDALAAELRTVLLTDPTKAYTSWVEMAKDPRFTLAAAWDRFADREVKACDEKLQKLKELVAKNQGPVEFETKVKEFDAQLAEFARELKSLMFSSWEDYVQRRGQRDALVNRGKAIVDAVDQQIAKLSPADPARLAAIASGLEELDSMTRSSSYPPLPSLVARIRTELTVGDKPSCDRADSIIRDLERIKQTLNILSGWFEKIRAMPALTSADPEIYPWTSSVADVLTASLRSAYEAELGKQIERFARLTDVPLPQDLERTLQDGIAKPMEVDKADAQSLLEWTRSIEDGAMPTTQEVGDWADGKKLASLRSGGKLPDAVSSRLDELKKIVAPKPDKRELTNLANRLGPAEIQLAAWRRLHALEPPAWPTTVDELRSEKSLRSNLTAMAEQTKRNPLKERIKGELEATRSKALQNFFEFADRQAMFDEAETVAREWRFDLDELARQGSFTRRASVNLRLYRLTQAVSQGKGDEQVQEHITLVQEAIKNPPNEYKEQFEAIRLLLAGAADFRNQRVDPSKAGPAKALVQTWKVQRATDESIDFGNGVVTLTFRKVVLKGGEESYLCTTEASFQLFDQLKGGEEWLRLLGGDRKREEEANKDKNKPYPPQGNPSAWTLLNVDPYVVPSTTWLFREGAFPDAGPARQVADRFAQGPPSKSPMTFVSPWVAVSFASLLGCRLPTSAEWEKALEQDDANPNLRDKTYEDLQKLVDSAIAGAGLGDDFGALDLGTFERHRTPQDGFKDHRGKRSGAAEREDRSALFRPVDAGDAAKGFRDLRGNVAEWVFDDRAASDKRLAAMDPEHPGDFIKAGIKNLRLAGASALSSDLKPNQTCDVRPEDLRYNSSDVGFRLAFSAPSSSRAVLAEKLGSSDRKGELYIPAPRTAPN